jgi:hypothetical protein
MNVQQRGLGGALDGSDGAKNAASTAHAVAAGPQQPAAACPFKGGPQ